MAIARSRKPARRQAAAGPFEGNGLAICTLLAAILIADASTVARLADFPLGTGNGGLSDGIANAGSFNGNGNSGNFNGNGNAGSFNGNGNSGNFNGNGNLGSFNGNANCGNGFGNGFSTDGNGNGNGKRQGRPDLCRFLKNLNGQLGLPPGTIPDFD